MNTALLIKFAPLLTLLITAAAIDLKHRRIPNWLNLTILATGFFQAFFSFHTVTPIQSIAGFAVGFVLPLALFMINAIGGGDVKLLAAIGCWVGPVNILLIIIVKDVVGLVIVLTQAMLQKRLGRLFRNSASIAINLISVRHVGVDTVQKMGLSSKSVDKPLPLAVPILVSVILLLVFGTGGIR